MNLLENLNKKIKSRGEAGFSLIEVMAALAIFGICMMAIFATQMNTIRQNARAKIRSQEMIIASDKVEELMGLGIDNVSLAVTDDDPHTEVNGPYTVSWTVTMNAAPFENSRTVDITVSSQSKFGGSVSVSMVKGP